MADYMTDKEQIQKIKEWWNEQGKWLAIAIAIGLALGFGWRYWQAYKHQRSEKAATLYQTMLNAEALNKAGVVTQYVEQLQAHYSHSPYTALAVFSAAKDDVTNKKYQAALTKYIWIEGHNTTSSFRQIARIRAARVFIAMKKYDEAMQQLAVTTNKYFEPMIENVKGDIYQAKGNKDAAMKAYQKAKEGYSKINVANPIMDIKLVS